MKEKKTKTKNNVDNTQLHLNSHEKTMHGFKKPCMALNGVFHHLIYFNINLFHTYTWKAENHKHWELFTLQK